MQFRKKPVIIEAFQMTPKRRIDNSEWPQWLHRAWNKEIGTEGSVYPAIPDSQFGLLAIGTKEEQCIIEWDYWIIKNEQDELSVCKPDNFETTYEIEEKEIGRVKGWLENGMIRLPRVFITDLGECVQVEAVIFTTKE